MSTPPDGIPDADWLSWPAGARQLILAQQKEIQALRKENDELRNQLTALATELAKLSERSCWSCSGSCLHWHGYKEGTIDSRLLTVATRLRQQGRDVWEFLEQAWVAHHRGGEMPSLLPDP
jgi:hypothetical protein